MFHYPVRLSGALILALLTSPCAWAFTLTSVIEFPAPTIAADTISGNQSNFQYNHLLSDFCTQTDCSQPVLLGGRLSLTHAGNTNEGPTRELWAAATGQGSIIGSLGTSSENSVTDAWILSAGILQELLETFPSPFEVHLSELTSFNGEKLELERSQLDLDFATLPEAPEPATFILVLSALALGRIFYPRPRA